MVLVAMFKNVTINGEIVYDAILSHISVCNLRDVPLFTSGYCFVIKVKKEPKNSKFCSI